MVYLLMELLYLIVWGTAKGSKASGNGDNSICWTRDAQMRTKEKITTWGCVALSERSTEIHHLTMNVEMNKVSPSVLLAGDPLAQALHGAWAR